MEKDENMEKDKKIYIAGHQGMVGAAMVRALRAKGYKNLLFKNKEQLDLRRQSCVENFFEKEKPDYVFLCAAKVGGIAYNNAHLAEFLYDNVMIEMNVLNAAFQHNVKKLLFLGSSCIYPVNAHQPIREEDLLTGRLEPTNEGYALAKISGLKYCEYLNRQCGANFISVMPTNLYGKNDNYHAQNAHVLPALLRRLHQAKISGMQEVVCWGTGKPLREFLYVDDLADACLFLMLHYNGMGPVNVGTGEEVSIEQLSRLVAKTVGYTGKIVWDNSKPDGASKKLCDLSKIHALGWRHTIALEEGLRLTYEDFLTNRVRGI